MYLLDQVFYLSKRISKLKETSVYTTEVSFLLHSISMVLMYEIYGFYKDVLRDKITKFNDVKVIEKNKIFYTYEYYLYNMGSNQENNKLIEIFDEWHIDKVDFIEIYKYYL